MMTLLLAALLLAMPAHGNDLQLARTIELPDVEGRIDHMAIDVRDQKLFIAALGNDSVEIVDLKAGKANRRLTGLAEPQGVLFHPKTGRLFVATAGDGRLGVYELPSLKHLKDIKLSSDADNIRYDAARDRVYVGHANGALAVVDPVTLAVESEIKLPGHPESFQLETRGPRIFVNIPGARQIAVLDRNRHGITAAWAQKWSANFPMAIDPSGRRIFIGFRSPAKLAVLDSKDGRQTQTVDLCGDCDDLYYDSRRSRVYASCGEGKINVFNAPMNGKIVMADAVPTANGARTSLFAQELDRLYLAVPHRGAQKSEIRVYLPEPPLPHSEANGF